MNKKIFIILSLFIFCLGLTGGVALDKTILSKKDPNDNFQTGWEAARSRLMTSGAFQGITKNVEIKSISGIVKNIKNSIITIKSTTINPLSDPNLDERNIEINNDTKITLFVKKSDQQYQDELNQTLKNNGNKLNPNVPDGGVKLYNSEAATLSQIQVGDQITVNTNEDIGNKKQFLAKEILFGK